MMKKTLFLLVFLPLFMACGSHELEVIITMDSSLDAQYDAGTTYVLAIFDARNNAVLFSQEFDGSKKERKTSLDDLPTGDYLKIEYQVKNSSGTTYMVGELAASDPVSISNLTSTYGPIFSVYDGELITLYLSMRTYP